MKCLCYNFRMEKVFIIHGVEGYPEENWFPWLKRKLEKRGIKVIVPAFPTPEGQTLKNWLEVMKKYEKEIDGSIVVGHSIGAVFLLSVLERHFVEAAYFVAGFLKIPKSSRFYKGGRSFTEKKFDFGKIMENCGKFTLFHSDNDPYVSLERAEELKEKLGAELNLVKGAGHLNSKAGYDEFEELYRKILVDSYLRAADLSIDSTFYRNFYIERDGVKIDILEDGRLSCAKFVSSVLKGFRLIKSEHSTIDGTVKDLKESGWEEANPDELHEGDVIIWNCVRDEEGGAHGHIGFYIGSRKAISNSTEKRVPKKHDATFEGQRKIVRVLRGGF